MLNNIFRNAIILSQKLRLISRLFSLNEIIFPHLYIVTNVLLLMELATYRGFTYRYLFLHTVFMVTLTTFSFLILIIPQIKKNGLLSATTIFTLQINKLSIVPLILINYLLISIDDYYYNNYLYSKFHINPHNFQLILSFNIAIFVLHILMRSKVATAYLSKLLNARSILHIIFYLTVMSFVIPQIHTVSTWLYQSSFRIIKTLNYTWKEKLIYLNGGEDNSGWIVIYTDFINKHVDPNGVIFIPPQKESWQMEGNPYYMRWFIYPRDTIQVQETTAAIPDEANYVLIDNGAWPNMTEYGWPKVGIPADEIEKMVFIDRVTKEETTIVGENYDPETMSYKWGVIQLKK